jgi:Zn finger protein HypA/HybF involved in hydrogenase expression
VRSVILDLKHPLKHEVVDEAAERTITWTAKEQLNICLEQMKKGRYLKPEELLAPTQREENSISYCPRCRCQFVVSDGECPDCPGVELVAF